MIDDSRADRLHEAAIPVAAIDPKRAAVVAHIATLGHAAAYDWLVDRVVELEGSLQTLWSAVAKYNSIGHEGSELLEVMSDAKSVLAARAQEPTL